MSIDLELARCFWAGSDALYIDYHDKRVGAAGSG